MKRELFVPRNRNKNYQLFFLLIRCFMLTNRQRETDANQELRLLLISNVNSVQSSWLIAIRLFLDCQLHRVNRVLSSFSLLCPRCLRNSKIQIIFLENKVCNSSLITKLFLWKKEWKFDHHFQQNPDLHERYFWQIIFHFTGRVDETFNFNIKNSHLKVRMVKNARIKIWISPNFLPCLHYPVHPHHGLSKSHQ